MLSRSFLSLALLLSACVTEQKVEEPRSPFPAWVKATELVPDPVLEAAAKALCERREATLSPAMRREFGVVDGQLDVATGKSAKETLIALTVSHPFTHLGAVSHDGCRAAIVVRRLAEPRSDLPFILETEVDALEVKWGARGSSRFFLSAPGGDVTELDVSAADGGFSARLPLDRPGTYRAELVVSDQERGPEVALLWPIEVGKASAGALGPAVLFPDDGHDDHALSLRTSALVHRLRAERELYPPKLAPALEALAKARATALASAEQLGHFVPDDDGAFTALNVAAPTFKVARLTELQAQGSTLQDAWFALLRSPAHRFELQHKSASHAGVWVVRSTDAADRTLVSVVVLMARKISELKEGRARARLRNKFNLARDEKGRRALMTSGALTEVAERQAAAMAQAGEARDDVLGNAVAELGIEADTDVSTVRSVLAALDDPLRLALSQATLDPRATRVGIGLARAANSGQWFVCVLTGTMAR